jgi:hypothetical protein
MREGTIQFLTGEKRTVSIRNGNAAVAILDGQPVYFKPAADFPGVDVLDYSAARAVGMVAGIAKCQLAAGLAIGEVGEAVCFGFTDAIVVRRTRSATNVTWASVAAIAFGDQLVPETGNKFLTHSNTPAIGAGAMPFVAGEAVASLADGVASTHLAGQTAETVRMKVLVRAM